MSQEPRKDFSIHYDAESVPSPTKAETRERAGSSGYDTMGGPSTLLNLDMKKIDKASPAKNTYTSGSCSGEAWDKEFPSQATRQYDQFKGELGASGSSSSSSSGK